MNKRTFIKSTIFGLGAIILLPSFSKVLKKQNSKFKITKLKYTSLEPFLDSETIKCHYENYHLKYVENFNSLIKKYNLEKFNIIDILKNISKYPEEIRFNAGGYFNHNIYWNQLSDNKKTIPFILQNAIENNFGSFDNFKQQFISSANSLFGSGWTWLILKSDKTLKIINTPNNDNPLMDTSEEHGHPLLAIDLWEHAYYNKYQNKRSDYINNFLNFIDWEYISMKYKALLNKKLYSEI